MLRKSDFEVFQHRIDEVERILGLKSLTGIVTR